MKNQVLKIRKVSILLILFAFALSTNAQITKKTKKKKKISKVTHINNSSNNNFKGCKTELLKKSGEVFSVSPGILNVRPSSNSIFVNIRKTGGRAATQVNIYVNGVLRQNQRIVFPNGRDTTPYKTQYVTDVKDKNVKVEIVNQSVGNSFKYMANINGYSKSLMKKFKPVKGVLAGQTVKSVYPKKACTGKIKIKITRVGGNARATIRVFEKQVNGSFGRQLKSVTFENNIAIKEIEIPSTKEIKIELKNISVGNMFRYKINAVAIQ